MKVAKPLKVPILTRVVEFKHKPRFHVTAMLAFPLAQPRALIDEIALWPAITPALGASLLDEGVTKARAELLVAGQFFAPDGQPKTVSFVRAQVGAVDKRLAVMGDRVWQSGGASSPRPMTEMPVDWVHAFGGKDHGRNPYGRGIGPVEQDGKTVHPLPNIERAADLVTSQSSRPEPDCFLPLDLSFEQRRARAGTFGPDYVDRYAPGLPPDHQPTFFNVAREDQWAPSLWKGDEKILVENMSPTSPRLESALPGLVTRAFVTQRTSQGDRFREVGLQCDTVWLFPSAGLGMVIFHGSLPIADADAADVAHVLVACEEPSTPRDVGHYEAALALRQDKDEAAIAMLSDADLMPPRSSGVAPSLDLGPMGQWLKTDLITLANSRRGQERRRQENCARLEAEGLDPARFGLDQPLPPAEAPPPTEDLEALADYLKQAEKRAKEAEAQAKAQQEESAARGRAARVELGLPPEEEPEEPPVGGPPAFRAEAAFAQYVEVASAARAAGAPQLDIEARLANPKFRDELDRLEAASWGAYAQNAHLLPPAAPMTEEANQIARALVQIARDSGEGLDERDFTGADLRGLDLSGMNFRAAFFEAADLRDADLREANLEGAVLARADLRGAKLDRARLAGANLGDTTLEGASFEAADLTKAVFMRARLGGASFLGAIFTGADFLEAVWGNPDFRESRLDACTFLHADLTGARFAGASLEGATFVECALDGADFGAANLHKAVFVTARGKSVRFAGARLSNAVFLMNCDLPGADFRDALLERACLRTSILRGARFDRARMAMADLSECDAAGSVFDQAIATQVLLIRAKLQGASLRGANLTEVLLTNAQVAGTDFSDAQLTRAQLIRARGDNETRFSGAVVKFTRFQKPADDAGGAS